MQVFLRLSSITHPYRYPRGKVPFVGRLVSSSALSPGLPLLNSSDSHQLFNYKGQMVKMPCGTLFPLTSEDIYAYGMDAVLEFWDEEECFSDNENMARIEKEAALARDIYARLRGNLVSSLEG